MSVRRSSQKFGAELIRFAANEKGRACTQKCNECCICAQLNGCWSRYANMKHTVISTRRFGSEIFNE